MEKPTKEQVTVTLNIIRIAVLTQRLSTDEVYIQVDLPPGCPAIDDSPLTLRFSAQKGTGVDYILKNFGRIPDEVISI